MVQIRFIGLISAAKFVEFSYTLIVLFQTDLSIRFLMETCLSINSQYNIFGHVPQRHKTGFQYARFKNNFAEFSLIILIFPNKASPLPALWSENLAPPPNHYCNYTTISWKY